MPPNAVFCTARYPVFWGGFNLILAIRECIRTACAIDRNLARFVLISGDSLPIAPLDKLEAALLDTEREYMDLYEVRDDPSLHNQAIARSIEKHGNEQPWRFQNYAFYDDELLSPRSRSEAMQKYGLAQDTTDHLRGSTERVVTEIFRHLGPR
jgi:hypothetical protein